jgi:hypothetical protein
VTRLNGPNQGERTRKPTVFRFDIDGTLAHNAERHIFD